MRSLDAGLHLYCSGVGIILIPRLRNGTLYCSWRRNLYDSEPSILGDCLQNAFDESSQPSRIVRLKSEDCCVRTSPTGSEVASLVFIVITEIFCSVRKMRGEHSPQSRRVPCKLTARTKGREHWHGVVELRFMIDIWTGVLIISVSGGWASLPSRCLNPCL